MCRKRPSKPPKELHKLKFNDSSFKTLRVWFSNDQEEITKLNYENNLNSIERIMNNWTSGKLSLKGKVTILKSLVLPQISHLLSMCYCPLSSLGHVNGILFCFVE